MGKRVQLKNLCVGTRFYLNDSSTIWYMKVDGSVVLDLDSIVYDREDDIVCVSWDGVLCFIDKNTEVTLTYSGYLL